MNQSINRSNESSSVKVSGKLELTKYCHKIVILVLVFLL